MQKSRLLNKKPENREAESDSTFACYRETGNFSWHERNTVKTILEYFLGVKDTQSLSFFLPQISVTSERSKA